MNEDSFSKLNPVISFLFFISAVVMGMFFVHPVLTGCSAVSGLIYYFTIKKRAGFRFLIFLACAFAVLSAINPLFNAGGSIVLFTYFGRPYTFESLLYGMSLAGMVVSVLCWFACYNAVMTSDKFIYIFGRILPALSVVLTMILRLIPEFKKKAGQIITARRCIGMAGDSSLNKKEKIRNGTVVLNALTVWALENAITSADSMNARGYGSGRRTNYKNYRFGRSDIIGTSVMAALVAFIIVCAANGGARASFIPELDISWFGNPWMTAACISYTVFLLIPSVFNIKEAITWRILRSGI